MSNDKSLAEALGAPTGPYDRVAAAYEGMSPADQEIFRKAIMDAHAYPHAHMATALRTMGYDVDRKQVQHFREKLALKKVEL